MNSLDLVNKLTKALTKLEDKYGFLVVKNVKELMKIYEDQQQLLIDEALKEAGK